MNFQIFEDQENLHGNSVASFADARKERVKLAPLANQASNNENACENQVRSIEKFCLPLFPSIFTFRPSNRSANHKSFLFRPRSSWLGHLSRKTCSALPMKRTRGRWSSRKSSRSPPNSRRSSMSPAENAAGQPAMLSTIRLRSGECPIV